MKTSTIRRAFAGPDRAVYEVCLLLVFSVIPSMIHDWIAGWPLPVFVMGGQQILTCLAAFSYLRGHQVAGAAILSCSTLAAAAIFISLSNEGLHNSAALMFPMAIVLAALLFETIPYLAFVCAAALTVAVLAVLQHYRILPLATWADDKPWIDILVILSITAMVAGLLVNRLRNSLRVSRDYGSALRALAAAGYGPSELFFEALGNELRRFLDVDDLLIFELTQAPVPGQLVALAGGAAGQLSLSGPFSPDDTILAETLRRQGWHCESIPDAPPPLARLTGTVGTSYFGTPIRAVSGNVVGLVAGLSASRREPGDLAQALLPIFLSSLASELEMRRADHALVERTRERDAENAANEQMLHTLQALTGRLEEVREQERTRIAREIHDELGQQLTAMRFELVNLGNRLRATMPPSGATDGSPVVGLTTMVDKTIQAVRRIATELRPGVLDTFGLAAALEWLVDDFQQRTGIAASYEGPDDLAVPEAASTALFRICQESLTNVARHSRAGEVSVVLAHGKGQITLEIADNGVGLVASPARSGSLGLVGMAERARIAGGNLSITTNPGRGVTVTARLPVPEHVETEPAA